MLKSNNSSSVAFICPNCSSSPVDSFYPVINKNNTFNCPFCDHVHQSSAIQQTKVNATNTKINRKTKAIEARNELKELSKAIKPIAKQLNLKLNDAILNYYKEDTQAKSFHTFGEWKKEGYKINKGSKGFKIWGKPVALKKSEIKEEDNKKSSSFFPVAYLYNETQVTKR